MSTEGERRLLPNLSGKRTEWDITSAIRRGFSFVSLNSPEHLLSVFLFVEK